MRKKMEIDYNDIDVGMREIVRNFNRAGYITTNSCEGHINDDDGSCSIPYISFIKPEDSTMLSFVLNNLSIEMYVDIEVPANYDNDTTLVEDDNEEYYVINLDNFIANHDPSDFEVRIYMNSIFSNDFEDFKRVQAMYLKNMLELSEYLIKVNEVYKECC